MLALHGQGVDQELVADMRPLDLDPVLPCKLSRRRGMVQMAMGQQHFFKCHADFRHGFFDSLQIPAGIDGGPFAGFLVPDERAILLEGGDGKDCDF